MANRIKAELERIRPQLDYMIARSLVVGRKRSPESIVYINISKCLAEHFANKYRLSGRFVNRNEILDDLGLIRLRMINSANGNEINSDTFKARIQKPSCLTCYDKDMKPRELFSSYKLKIKFNVHSFVL
jgi:hypothetical protein